MGAKPEVIGTTRSGRPVYPIAGGSTGEETPPPPDPKEVTVGGKTALAWQAEARKWEGRAKANQEAAQKLEEAASADKGALAKLQESFDKAEKRAAEAELSALRTTVASEKKLSAAQARRLTGTTREEIEADAADLIEAFGIKADDGKPNGDDDGKPAPTDGGRPRAPGSRPQESLSGGGEAESAVLELDPRKLARQIEGAG